MNPAWQHFSEQIAFEASLPLQIEALAADHQTSPASGRMQLNASILDTLLAMDRPGRPTLVDEERNDYSGELQLISARLDLVMTLLGRLSPPPDAPARPLRLNAHGAILPAELLDEASQGSGHCLLRIYFEHCPTVALELSGQLDAQHPGFLGFDALSPEVHDGIERMVFMHHRRQIAAARNK